MKSNYQNPSMMQFIKTHGFMFNIIFYFLPKAKKRIVKNVCQFDTFRAQSVSFLVENCINNAKYDV